MSTQAARTLQNTLSHIDQGKKIFFNIALFESKGLTYSRKQWRKDAKGNSVVIGHKHYLTDKAKRFLGVVV